MLRTLILTTALAAGATAPAAAQSWGIGVGVEYGPPVFYGPPPVIYYEPPVVAAPPPVYYGAPPVVVAPAPVIEMVSPDEVFDRLDEAGYTDLAPMAQRGRYYKVRAVDPYGNLVSLEISIHSGEIENKYILESGYAARPAVVAPPVVATAPPPPPPARAAAPPPPAAPSAAPPTSLRDRLVVPEEPEDGDDPLVIY
jgi:hypothetical protein